MRRSAALVAISIVTLLTFSASAQEPDWGGNVYQPGTAQGRQGKPTDAGLQPRWVARSHAEPSLVELGEDYLRIATGSAEKPAAGARTFEMPIANADAGLTCEVVFRVHEQRGKHYAGGFLIAAGSTSFVELTMGQKHLLLTGAGGWTNGDYSQWTALRIVVEPIGQGAMRTTVYLRGDSKPIQVSEKLAAAPTAIRIGDSSTSDSTNGVIDWQEVRWLPGQVLHPPPPKGQSSAQRPLFPDENPISVATTRAADQVRVERYQESEQQASFVVDAEGKVYLTLRPRVMKITAGSVYSINTTLFDPWQVTATQDGQLTLALSSPRNCGVLVEPSPGANLLPDPSFEEDESSRSAWIGRAERTQRATLAFGHESLDGEEGRALQELDGQTTAARATDKARSGRASFKLYKTGVFGNAVCQLAQPIAIEPGQEYLLSAYYHFPQPTFGAALHMVAQLSGDQQKPLYFRDIQINPPVASEPGQWQRTFVRFKAPAGYSSFSLSLSSRGAPCEVWWDDIELRQAPTAVVQWPRALPPERGLPRYTRQQVEAIWSKRSAVQAAVDRNRGVPVIQFDGEAAPMLGVTALREFPYRDFSEAGTRLRWAGVYVSALNYYGRKQPAIWLGDGQYDFAPLDEKLAYVLGHDPHVPVMLYLSIDPYPEFGDRHPEAVWHSRRGLPLAGWKESAREVKGPRQETDLWHPSYTASEFRRQAADMLTAMGRHLAESTMGRAVVGVHIVCGSDGQWFAPGRDHLDRSPGNLAAYRQWLQQRYGSDAALQKAWADAAVTIDTAAFPAEEQREPEKLFLQPGSADQRLIDAQRFHSEGVAQTINQLAAALKGGVERPFLVTTYYHDILHNHLLNHSALATLLHSDALDGIVSVCEYGLFRRLGRVGSYSSLSASLRLHGKFHLAELDYRTSDSWLPADALNFRRDWGVPADEAGFTHQLRRDMGMMLAQGQGAWLYALGGNGYMNDRYLGGVAEAVRAADLAARHPQPAQRGGVAVFCDEQVEDYATRRDVFGTILAMAGHNTARVPLSRSGLGWDAYLLSDLQHPSRDDYRLMMFLSAVSMTPQQIEYVQKNLQRDGRVLVFVNAAGMAMGDGFEANIRRLTGMNVKVDLNQVDVYRFVPAQVNDPLAVSIANLYTETRQPLFYVDDQQATPLAYLTGTDRKVGMAVRRFKDWTSVYISLPGAFTPALLRALAREAGVQAVGPEGDATYVGNGFVTLHALTPGDKKLTFEQPCNLFDLSLGRTVARGVSEYLVPQMHVGQTQWFYMSQNDAELAWQPR